MAQVLGKVFGNKCPRVTSQRSAKPLEPFGGKSSFAYFQMADLLVGCTH